MGGPRALARRDNPGHPLPVLPAPGHLTVREVRITTRMDRTIRYLIPLFTPVPGTPAEP